MKGEMLRRLGRFDEARAWFERLADEVASGTDEGTVIKLQLAMVAARNAENATVPGEELEAARTSEAWLVARRPILSSNSHLDTVARQFRTTGRLGFVWSYDSSAAYAVKDEEGSKPVLRQYPFAGSPTMPELRFGYSLVRLLAGLPNGNLLIQRSDGLKPGTAQFHEVSPATGQEVSSTPVPQFFYDSALLSSDGSLVFLEAAPLAFTAYSISARAVVSIPGGAGQDERAWRLFDAAPDAPLLLAQARREGHLPPTGLVVWNYERQRPEYVIEADASERSDSDPAHVIGGAISAAAGELMVLRWPWRSNGCEVGFYDLPTGRLQASHKSVGGRPALSRSLDGRYVGFVCGGRFELLDATTPGRVLETALAPLDLKFDSVRFSPDSHYLALEAGNVVTVFSFR